MPPIVSDTVSDLAAPPGGSFVLYSLRDDDVVEAADSATTAWDIGFRGTEVILNGGSSGPGAGIGVIAPVLYTTVNDALIESVTYRRDGESPCLSGPPRAVCTGAGDGWFETQGVAGGTTIVPIPDQTLLLRLGDGRGFAKVRFRSYYRGAPASPSASSEPGVYTFDFTVNPTGSSFVEGD